VVVDQAPETLAFGEKVRDDSLQEPDLRRTRRSASPDWETRSSEGFLNLTCGIDQIMPEREQQLEEFANLNLTINVDTTTDRYRFSVNPRELTAFVSLAALERLWAYLYFYLSAVKIYGNANGSSTSYLIGPK
jgi:hypothetical protein